MAAGLGLLLSTVGFDVIAGNLRYTFDWAPLEDGIPLIQALVGCSPSPRRSFSPRARRPFRASPSSRQLLGRRAHLFPAPGDHVRSALIGLAVGVLPAVGQSSAGLLAWADAKRISKHPKTFGQGAPEGVLASETATNACMPGIWSAPSRWAFRGASVRPSFWG